MTAVPANNVLVKVADLSLSYVTKRAVVRAVRGIDLEISAGEAVGLVGESGSGKSTLARALLGLNPPRRVRIDGGRLEIEGRDVTTLSDDDWTEFRGSPVAMVFQDPLSFLNPVMRVERQIFESIKRHEPGIDAAARIDELLSLVKLPGSVRRAYPHELSGGMRQRVLLAIALACRPKLLVADEPTTALDVTTQAEIMALLGELRQRLGMALLFISHDLALVSAECDRIYVMYAGRLVESGSSKAVTYQSRHPYTRELFNAARALRLPNGRFSTIGGDVPNLAQMVEGCPFQSRCPLVFEPCNVMPPASQAPGLEHMVRCWAHQEGRLSTAEANANA